MYMYKYVYMYVHMHMYDLYWIVVLLHLDTLIPECILILILIIPIPMFPDQGY